MDEILGLLAKQRVSSFSPSHSQHSSSDSQQQQLSLSSLQTQTQLSTNISPLKMADAGFEHLPTTGNDYSDAVICNQCKLVYSNWDGESPMAVHTTLQPQCPFLKAATESRFRSESPFTSSPSPQMEIALDHLSSNNSDNENHIVCSNRLNHIRRQLFPSSPNNSLDVQTQTRFIPKDGNRLMLFESLRKLTFMEPCSSTAAIYAAAGFKFCENGFCVCVFCDLELEFIPYGSSVRLEMIHEERSPLCPFAKGYDVCNISSDSERQIKAKFHWRNVSPSQMANTEVSMNENVSYSVKYIEFEKKEARIGTFKTWPEIANNEFPPEKMADCGFFYSGGGDCVQCFCCGVGLYKWVENVDPFRQHARASPQCMYLLKIKGQQFMSDSQHEELMVRANLGHIGLSESDSSPSSPSSSSSPSSPPSTPPQQPSSPLGTPCLNMDTIKNALACGQTYPNDKLLQAFLKAGNENHKQVCEQREEIMKHKSELKVKDTVIESKESVIQAKDSVIHEKDSVIHEKDSVIQATKTQLHEKDSVIHAKDSQLKAKDRELASTRRSLQCQDVQERSALVQQIEQQNEMLHQHKEQLEHRDEVIEHNMEVIEHNMEELEHKDNEIDLRDREIEQLNSHVLSLMEALRQRDPGYQWNGQVPASKNTPVPICLICLNKPSRIAFFPCGHLCCCNSCAPRLEGGSCPVCRGPKDRQEVVFVN